MPNLRDLGGYTATNGATIAGGLVYRSNQLSGITQDDMKKLSELGLKVSLDLRTWAERSARPDELPSGTKYVWLDVLADSPQAGPAQLEKLLQDPKSANAELGGGKVEAMFQASYREFISLPSAKKEFRNFYLILGDKSQLPALFHCTTDKDRTGWAAAALLAAGSNMRLRRSGMARITPEDHHHLLISAGQTEIGLMLPRPRP